MNRAERRAHARSLRNRGAGWTRPVCHRSLKEIERQGVGLRRMMVVAARLDRGELPLEHRP